jgi:UDP-3-O-[3-hydroxymyristoyl] glucosamine N-acyltransferase
MLGAQSGVTGNVAPNQMLSGNPPIPVKEHLKVKASLKKLPGLVKAVKRLEKAIEK